jgi:hypothetical protein
MALRRISEGEKRGDKKLVVIAVEKVKGNKHGRGIKLYLYRTPISWTI